MLKRIGLAISLVAALMWSGTALAQSPASIPPPASVTRINFLPGTSSYTFTTSLASGVSNGYVFAASAGQSLYITKSGDANVEVFDPLGNILAAPTIQPGPWSVSAPRNGDYTLVLYGQGPVTVSIYVPPVYFSQAYAAIAAFYRQRISFAPGTSSYSLAQVFQQGQPLAFVLSISGGQQLGITTQGNVTAAVLGLDGNPLAAATSPYGQWQYNIPLSGDYTLVLSGAGSGWITIAIPPFGSNPLPSGPTRIHFLPGNASLTTFANVQAGSPVPQYLLGIAAGQTLYIATTGSVFSVHVFDSVGNLVPGFATPYGSLGFYIAQTGDYRVVVNGSGLIYITFYIPPLRWW